MNKAYKVALISLGCAKNLINSEQMAHLLERAGHKLQPESAGADAVIINTCGFIESAKMEAINSILELADLKERGEIGKIIVCGCLPQRYRDDFLKELPETDAIIGTGSFGEILNALESVMAGGSVQLFGDISVPLDETPRLVSTGPGWAYIKIAEGCDNRCSYCVIPDIRGSFRSRPAESILREARLFAGSGIRELIVVAQDTSRYGRDLYGRGTLPELLKELCGIEGIEWIRLHYLYPDEISDKLIEVIAYEEKIVKYLDIPIQHINDSILKAMNRRGSGGQIKRLFKRLRAEIPEVVLRTSLITGLPGEGEAEFYELCEFLRQARIERAGVFPYSPEEGTKASEMPGRPEPEEAERRAGLISELQSEIMDEFNNSRVGKNVRVICDGFDNDLGLWYGRSFAESPEIDGRILLNGECAAGQFFEAHIAGILDGELFGEIIARQKEADR